MTSSIPTVTRTDTAGSTMAATSGFDPATVPGLAQTDARLHAQDLLAFIQDSRSPWHATANAATRLEAAGFTALDEAERWSIRPGGRHYVIRGGSSLIAFVAGHAAPAQAGFRLVGAHTDSPGLRLKPHAAHVTDGFVRLGVEVYGGPILATFADRDLGLAGRVHLRDAQAPHGVRAQLLHVAEPLLRLPNLAIHMNREVNEQGLKLHRQNELPLLFAVADAHGADAFTYWLAERLDCQVEDVLSVELLACDTQAGVLWGPHQQFMASSQLDNLACTHAGLQALLAVQAPAHSAVAAFFDHEEVGSESAVGAAGTFFADTLMRLAEALDCSGSAYAQARARSLFISADMAHAWNPNFPAAYEPQHRLYVNAGLAIKHNASQRYTSEGAGVARFVRLCEDAGVPCQSYVHRGDLACGSTIGPLVAARLGMPSLDIGAPMWAMHSLRESAGVLDSWWMRLALEQVLQ